MPTMSTYRCTRPDLYRSGTVGHTNLGARQGHYINAESEQAAAAQMSKNYPNDTTFDVQADEPWETSSARRFIVSPSGKVYARGT